MAALEPAVDVVAADADDGHPRCRSDPDSLADGIFVRPVLSSEGLGDDRDELRVLAVGVGESAPRHDRRLQRREQVRRRHAVVDARRIVGIRVRLAVDLDRAAPIVVRSGHDVDRRCRLDPRHRAKAFDDVGGKPRLAVGGRIARVGQLQAHREQAVGVESLRPVQELVNGEHTQGRRDEQRQRQRHFADDQPAAQPQPAGACRRPARAVLEGLGHARPRRLDRRHEAEDECGREGEQGREARESQVDVHLLPARDEPGNLRGHVARDELEAHPGHRERWQGLTRARGSRSRAGSRARRASGWRQSQGVSPSPDAARRRAPAAGWPRSRRR